MNGAHKKYSVLLTDLYQLTMAYGYWKNRVHEREAVFHLFFRKNPFQSGYSVACGLADAIEYIQQFRVDEEELAYLGTLRGNDGQALFEKGFLDYLRDLKFTCDIDAVPEGTVIFPHEPLIRVRGPILQGQLLETALLNIINFQTLIATKAARVCQATEGEPVLEFGLRRAQGIDGGMAASRAAHIGGCAATSNVLAGMRYGIPVRGTHAHSWVMSFDTEEEAFNAYAHAMPNNCVFLVDTYDTLEGVQHAVQVGRKLREQGHEMVGIRLDSGDLAYLSIEARKILDDAGFPQALIVASNDLDEHIITSLKQQGARISIWGVGTKLVTAYDQPAMGGVYKLGAVRDAAGEWHYRLKLSEQAIKISNPGIQQVRRFFHEGEFIGDMIYNEGRPVKNDHLIVDPTNMTRSKKIPPSATAEDLLVPVFREGALNYEAPSIAQIRERTASQLAGFHPGIKRFLNPHLYPVGLELGLYHLKTDLILKARGIEA
ncbi:nicotinate phosphoribosyltransferase [Spartobacteria bacterium LR76]|nr:nicotinate phosphoribosyltransferase [Spartobacteria bacterium LR76]